MTVSGLGGGNVVAGGVGEYTRFGFMSWPAAGCDAVSKIGSVQYVKTVAESVVPSGL